MLLSWSEFDVRFGLSSTCFFLSIWIRVNTSKSASCPVHFLIFHKDQEKFVLPNLFLCLSVTQLLFQNYFLQLFHRRNCIISWQSTSSVNELTFLKRKWHLNIIKTFKNNTKHVSVELLYQTAGCIKESIWISWVPVFPPLGFIRGLIYSCNFSVHGNFLR